LAEKRERMNSAASTTTVMIAHFSGVISAQSCSLLLIADQLSWTVAWPPQSISHVAI
jgi:hypothetical protein